jgi:hypothetical protein
MCPLLNQREWSKIGSQQEYICFNSSSPARIAGGANTEEARGGWRDRWRTEVRPGEAGRDRKEKEVRFVSLMPRGLCTWAKPVCLW